MTFIGMHLGGDERDKIDNVQILNPDVVIDNYDNSEKKVIDGGGDTVDRLFCLSIDEAKQYFKNDLSRQCELIKWEINHGGTTFEKQCIQFSETDKSFVEKLKNNQDKKNNCEWWLRSPAKHYNVYGRYRNFIDFFGSYLYPAKIETFAVDRVKFIAVRPAMWVKCE